MSARIGFTLNPEGYEFIRREVKKEDVALIQRVFHTNDEGKKGYLTRVDLKVAVVELLGYKPAKFEVNQIFEKYAVEVAEDIQGLHLEGFTSCMCAKLAGQDEDDEIRHTFMALDAQCRGFLTLEEVKKAFSSVAPHVPEQVIHSAFREIDQDGDGRVSFKDFQFLMKYSLEDHI
ncbi:EF-hand calcium-binding domain-containing protein 11-like [Dreissena polymorpha]|uniref:Sulfhydryl light chain n=1 Tax=Dreissena polymorpha TaxID=45954 RepID=A0A9D4QW59_DREPO|nr:EF-hand calcium-binding domain-containing protein 11-like [Dreissena polymorpha]XP_052272458.1 EF-hand calcium-binding domain-containing protein 11-like [Dreissena polymorpha]XP_052272459.1 EF-hand calcium-binding domain-containing protein 11-like [Dreissena polymorpha]XP_052272460.1 EF-hand calcium-binding domain-containing protein 11-like [Dreissena polymorpha]KAH3844952.1 hypothetical protein DPMN_087218 [Dreissena polymorpha]KAH3844984.1 hypothetical protein DPMN_087253 [Dreissena polym